MRTFLPQTRFSGMVITIVLLLLLTLGFFTVFTSHQNEQRIVKRGFITLKQNAFSIKNKITSLSTLAKNKQRIPENLAYNTWIKDYSLIIDTAGKVEISNGIPSQIIKKKITNTNDSIIPSPVSKPKQTIKSSEVSTNDSLVSSNAFFSDILDNSFFDEYIVFKDTMLFYKSFETEPELLNGTYLENFKKSLYLPANFNIFNSKSDSSVFTGGWNTGFISRIDLGYNKYFLFVYPLQVNNQHWYVGGLLTNQNYLVKKRHIEPWILIFIGILLTFTLFSFQFIKLFQLSKTERVKTSDLVILCFSISGVGCIVTLLILNFFSREILIENSNARLKELSDSVKHSFTTEMKLMYQSVESYEAGKHNWENPTVPRTHILTSSELSKFVKDTAAILRMPYFKSLFLAYQSASKEANRTMYMLSTWEKDASSRISYRQYYQKKDEWLLPDTIDNVRFRLESVYSNTNGEVLAVMGKPSKFSADTVFGIASPLYSLMNTILSPGFEFRVIGADGKIWFHNNKRKNNQDNILDECNKGRILKEAIQNRVEAYTDLKISEKDYQCYISPIGKLPLFLVTLSDSGEQNDFLSHVNYIFFIYILIGLLWGLVAAAVFYYEKMGKYTRGSLDEDPEPGIVWLLPDTRKNYRYMILFVLNGILSLFLLIPLLSKQVSVLHLFYILFSAFSICAIYIYVLLKPFKKKVLKKSLPIMFTAVILICNLVYYISLPGFLVFFAIEVGAVLFIAFVVVVVIRSIRLSPPNNPEEILKNNLPAIVSKAQVKFFKRSTDPYLPYMFFLFSWVFATCIIPIFVLFKTAVKEEVELVTKKNQIELAQKIEKKNLEIDSFYIKHIYPAKNPANQPYLDTIKYQLKQKGNYLLGFGTVFTDNNLKSDKPQRPHKSDTAKLVVNDYMSQVIRKNDVKNRQMLSDTAQSPLWYWQGGYLNRPPSDTLILHYTSKQKNPDRLLSSIDLQMMSILTHQKTHIYTSYASYLLGLTMMVLFFLFLLFLLLKALVKNVFFLNNPNDLNIITNHKYILESGNLFLINAIHQDYIKQLLPSYTNLSFDNLTTPATGKNTLILFNSIPTSTEAWKQAISALEEIIRKQNNHVVIVSCFTPVQVRTMVDEQIIAASDSETLTALKDTKRQLLHLFSLFTVYFYQNPDDEENLNVFLEKCIHLAPSNINKEELRDYLSHELKFAFGFIGKREKLDQVICGHQTLQDIRLKLYQLFMPYYQYIWENCTVNEKFILFDMAMDTMANPKNRDEIRNLIGKGILTVEGKLDFVSFSFKRFVMELSDTAEFITLEMASKRAGGWSKIKGPMYFIFIILVIFVFFTQQDIISGLYGAVISIAGLLAALFKFGSIGKESGDEDK